MQKITGRSAVWLILMLSAVSSFGQDRSLWRTSADVRSGVRGSIVATVVDVDAAKRQLSVTADDDRSARINVITDSVSTQYNGFGGMINGQPEIFTGSNGFSNVRLGDRLEIRGTGRANAVIAAEQMTLLGRSTPISSSGNTASPALGTGTDNWSRVSGLVRQVNVAENRLVVETDRREMITVRTTTRTPVYYQGQTYAVSNLEVGDRVNVEPETGTVNDREVRARTIEVTRSVREGTTDTPSRSVGSITGKITRIDRTNDIAWVMNGRVETRLDMSRAYDAQGRRVRAIDVRVGDQVELSGNYSGQTFVVTTVRFDDDVFNSSDDDESDDDLGDFVTVSMSATVVESLADSATLVIRERNGGKTLHLFVTEDFVVKTKSGGYTTADRLKAGDGILIKAYRDNDENLIAQTIRYR
jgi:hypothetical protein